MRDKEIVEKIIKYCNDIEKLKTQYDNDFDKYQKDISFQYSCNMCIIQIGELVGRLSDDFTEANNDIPWYSIRAMRNLHAHDYENVDMSIVWNTLQDDIPDLKEKLQSII